jgi:RNA recognition motif-containing protein
LAVVSSIKIFEQISKFIFQSKAERGYGFVTFSSIAEADKVLETKNYIIGDKEIEVKRSIANRSSNQTVSIC